jgi:hypothetical protein
MAGLRMLVGQFSPIERELTRLHESDNQTTCFFTTCYRSMSPRPAMPFLAQISRSSVTPNPKIQTTLVLYLE